MIYLDETSENEQLSYLNEVVKLKHKENSKETQCEQRRIINPLWNEYSQRSTIHGVSYLGENELHWTKRIWWILSFCASIIVCFYCIYKVYIKLTPVIITFADYTTPITEINFPTITICNDVKTMPDVLKYDLELFDKEHLSVEAIQQMFSLMNVCEDRGKIYEYVRNRNVTIDANVMQHLKAVTPDLFHILNRQHCNFYEHSYFHCGSAFKEIVTDDGLCYTFNHLKSQDIYRTEMLANDFPTVEPFKFTLQDTETYSGVLSHYTEVQHPYRMKKSGQGLRIKLTLDLTRRYKDYHCRKDFVFPRNCLILIVHSAEDVPQVKNSFHSIPLNHMARLTVTPNIIKTDPLVIENYSKYQRKCVAEHENHLKFFKIYSQSNCQLEQLVNATMDRCTCTLFWMPRTNETRICTSATEISCIARTKYFIFNTIDTTLCLPSCNSTSYDVEMTTFMLSNAAPNRSDVVITISFKHEQYLSTLRSESFGTIDFICGCGGILSLFLGLSFISIAEILYFSILRLFDLLRPRPQRQADNQVFGLHPVNVEITRENIYESVSSDLPSTLDLK